jgi:hypothetical protein
MYHSYSSYESTTSIEQEAQACKGLENAEGRASRQERRPCPTYVTGGSLQAAEKYRSRDGRKNGAPPSRKQMAEVSPSFPSSVKVLTHTHFSEKDTSLKFTPRSVTSN